MMTTNISSSPSFTLTSPSMGDDDDYSPHLHPRPTMVTRHDETTTMTQQQHDDDDDDTVVLSLPLPLCPHLPQDDTMRRQRQRQRRCHPRPHPPPSPGTRTIVTSPGPGQARPKPSQSLLVGPGLDFSEAKAPQGRAMHNTRHRYGN
jgi:hypothetical protein